MYQKLIKNEFRDKLWNQIILFLFMTLSVTLAVSVCVMIVQLFSTLTAMYEKANPPHFLQMHKGEISQENIDSFNEAFEGLTFAQTVPMIDVYGEEIFIEHPENGEKEEFSLEACLLDISLVKQNRVEKTDTASSTPGYDVLLDENRNILQIKAGEIGVPVILLEQFDIRKDDILTLRSGDREKSFIVTDYVYDGQMNSTLCSSTRFLISDEDFAELCGKVGEMEYLIEAYFEDSSQASDYQSAYEESSLNLPKDGQAVTRPLIFLLSAMTDLMTAMVFLLMGIIFIVISLLCLRFCLLAELQEEKREIGTMKAMGIPAAGIKKLYVVKIRMLMAAGVIVGGLLSPFVSGVLMGRMRRTFGAVNISPVTALAGVATAVFLYGIVLFFAKKVVARIQKLSVVDLMVRERGFEKENSIREVQRGISNGRFMKKLPTNLLYGIWEGKNGYGIMFGLLFLVALLIQIPSRVTETMGHEEFITYMGSPVSDILVELEQGEGLEKRKEMAEELLEKEADEGKIEDFTMYRKVRLQSENEQGERLGLHIDTGEGAGAGLHYLEGKEPENEQEIALSKLVAEELSKKTGDTLLIVAGEEKLQFLVSGVYQDVTSGGKTAKAVHDFADMEAEKYSFSIMLKDRTDRAEMALYLRDKLGTGFDVEDMEAFITASVGGVAGAVRKAATASLAVGIFLVILILSLFLKLKIAGRAGDFATKRAMGVPMRNIFLQEIYAVLFADGLGMAVGFLVAEVLGDDFVSILFSMTGMGLEKIVFSPLVPGKLLMTVAVLLAVMAVVTWVCCLEIRKLKIADYVNE